MIAYKKPVIKNYNGDLSKDWYVYFSVYDPNQGKMIPIKKYEGLKNITDLTARNIAAVKLKEYWESKLASGWTPWFSGDVVYTSQLEYQKRNAAGIRKCYSKRSFDYLATKYFNEKIAVRKFADKTNGSYKSKLRQFGLWLEQQNLHDTDISKINHAVILQFFRYQIIDLNRNRLTCEKYLQVLRSFFDYVCVTNNPVHNVDLPVYIETDTNRPITVAHRKILYTEIAKTDIWLWLAVQFISYTFVRCGRELRNMKVGWIDFDNGRLAIPPYFGKNRDICRIIIPDHFLNELKFKYYLHLINKEYYIFARNGVPGPEMIGHNTMRNRFNRIRDRLNLPKSYKFYSPRHTAAKMASDANIPIKHLQQQMRHKNLETTDKYISKLQGFESDNIKYQFPEL